MNDSEVLVSSNYTIEITDSIQIDRMISLPSIVSTHPENGNLLIMTSERDKELVLVMSQEGELIKEFEYPKEGPSSAGYPIISANFFEDGYAIMGYGYLITYDLDFNVSKRLRIPVRSSGMIYSRNNHLKTIEKDGKSHLLIQYGVETEKQVIEAEYYDEYNLLTVVDAENETFESYGRFHEGSMFKSGKAFYFIRTFFETANDKTKAIINNDTVLYTFDNAGNELARSVIPFDEYIMFKGYTLGMDGFEEQGKQGYIGGEITSYLNFDDFDVISYKSGLSSEKLQQYRNPDGVGYDREAISKGNPQKLIILKEGKLASEVLSLPEQIMSLGASDKFGNIWASQNVNALSEEPEVVTIYKLRIVEN